MNLKSELGLFVVGRYGVLLPTPSVLSHIRQIARLSSFISLQLDNRRIHVL